MHSTDDILCSMGKGLQIDNLTLSIGGRLILDGISMALESGTFAALCGHNGAGKSQLLRCIKGLRKQDGGRILFSMLREGKKDEEIEEALMKLSQDLEIKVNGVFQPIRVAITNSQVSLPLFDSISLLGLDEAERRLERALRMIKEK